ncbi:ArnT family glycosyltransferase [Mycolicibacterium stellerae]|uniref:ArnT family glycosyltransferase n=1 Tax=Mycolicibacterium stellerae TaxID=2358193 RepID=UPI000F0BBFF8|nr:glycosyltransferase family 39 protein [Mycolicibacterium stellerae]
MTSTLQAPTAADAAGQIPVRIRRRIGEVNRRRVALGVLLVATAVTYLWNITVNGMGNQFYAGAAQAGSKNWEALLFGSVDPDNFITVDKPPVSQWVMGLSGQLFGFSSASMLVPEALMAVASVALLYGAVRRIAGANAGLLAGALFALTPVVALMFRYNNPDAVMVLLMTAAAYCTVRALERASAKWLALAGAALGFAFLAKMLEGLMVAPAIGLAYMIVAPTTLRRRLLHVGAAALACLASAGWFVVLTLLWPASSRPYLAGSTDNNFMNLVLGYNGLARVLGRDHGGAFMFGPSIGSALGSDVRISSVRHGDFNAFGGAGAGITRLFSGEFGFEIGWLLPAALLALVVVVVTRRRARRADLTRGGAILFGGWLLIDGLVLSYMKGMAHPYYCLSVAPAMAGLVAIGGSEAWRLRHTIFGRSALAAMILVTGIWSWWLLGRNADWLPALRWAILTVTIAATIALLVALGSPHRRRAAKVCLAAAVVVAGAGSASYTFATIGQSHEGGGARVGPAVADGNGFGRGGWMDDDADNTALQDLLEGTHNQWSAAINGSSAAAGLELSTNTAVMAIGGFSGSDPVPSLRQFQDDVTNHRIGYYIAPDTARGHGRQQHTDITRWVAANFLPVRAGSATVYDLSAPSH